MIQQLLHLALSQHSLPCLALTLRPCQVHVLPGAGGRLEPRSSCSRALKAQPAGHAVRTGVLHAYLCRSCCRTRTKVSKDVFFFCRGCQRAILTDPNIWRVLLHSKATCKLTHNCLHFRILLVPFCWKSIFPGAYRSEVEISPSTTQPRPSPSSGEDKNKRLPFKVKVPLALFSVLPFIVKYYAFNRNKNKHARAREA